MGFILLYVGVIWVCLIPVCYIREFRSLGRAPGLLPKRRMVPQPARKSRISAYPGFRTLGHQPADGRGSPHGGELRQAAGVVSPAQIATGCCLVAAIITANTINRTGDFSANRIRAAASVTRLSVSWPRHPPLAPKRARGSLGHGPRRGCVCVSPRRGHHVLHAPSRFKSL